MNKTFDELYKVDVTPYVKNRDGAPYLNWADCKMLLHKNGAEKVYFEPCTNENGSSLFMSDMVFTDKNGVTNRCYEVKVHIVIDDLEFDAQFPVYNGANPVKDNSMSQQRVWNAQTRAFVKGVAIRTGLGFSLWADAAEDAYTEDDLSKHHLSSVKERMLQKVTELIKRGKTTSEISAECGMDEDSFRLTLKQYFSTLSNMEKHLDKMLGEDK